MAITVVAIRHAKPLSEGYPDDSLRPLSEEGKIVQRKVLERLRDQGIHPTVLLASPLLRAKQTAQLATDLFGIPFKEEPALGNVFDPKVLLNKLSQVEQNATIFLVGHAPTLGEFVNQLAGGSVLPLGMDKSSAAILSFEGTIDYGKGQLLHYFKPE